MTCSGKRGNPLLCVSGILKTDHTLKQMHLAADYTACMSFGANMGIYTDTGGEIRQTNSPHLLGHNPE